MSSRSNFLLSLTLTLFSTMLSPLASASMNIKPFYLEEDRACPTENETEKYIDVPLFYDLAEVAQTERIPGLQTHDDLREYYEGAQLRLFYEFLKPYDAAKPTIIFLAGGPGDNHTFMHGLEPLIGLYTSLMESHNILTMDHRGVGCSKALFPGNEPPQSLYMRYAASDIETLRREVLGPKAPLYVWGGSYGTILAQTYALLYPDNLKGMFLWEPISSHLDFNRAMQKYEDMVISILSPEQVLDYNVLKAEEPDYVKRFLTFATVPYYQYQGREEYLPRVFSELAELLENKAYKAADELIRPFDEPDGMFIASWMMRSIACGEIFTNKPVYEGEFDGFGFWETCDEFEGRAEYFNYDELLKQIKTPTFIYSGVFDHVTPIEAAVKMHSLLPNSYLHIDLHAGHGVDKPECFSLFLDAFFTEASAQAMDDLGWSKVCTERPSLF